MSGVWLEITPQLPQACVAFLMAFSAVREWRAVDRQSATLQSLFIRARCLEDKFIDLSNLPMVPTHIERCPLPPQAGEVTQILDNCQIERQLDQNIAPFLTAYAGIVEPENIAHRKNY